jgi:tetratricopeptide (TPR) repeat protein
MSRGQAAVESAKSTQDFDSSIRELEQAALNAPVWPDAYYNLGMVQGKLERYDEAIRNLQKYLDLAPAAGDAEQVKTMIYQMEYRKEKAAKPQVPARTGR